MVETFTRATATALMKTVEKAVREATEEHGITASVDKGRYSPKVLTITLSFTLPDEDGEQSKIEADFKTFAPRVGLSAEELGKTIWLNGVKHEIAGFKPGNRKYPVITKAHGKTYKWPVSAIRRALAE